MDRLIFPEGYQSLLNPKETQKATEYVRGRFQTNLGNVLHLNRITCPLFVTKESGINDDLNGVERKVEFDMKNVDGTAQVVQSLAKWKRTALAVYGFEPGEGKTTYGTGSSVMFNIGESPVPAPNGMVCSVGFSLFDHNYYVLEGHVHSSGAVLDWITDNLRLVDSTEDTQTLAQSVPDNGGVYFVPAFNGLGSPWWVPEAKAMITGLTMQATRAHVVRAALESIAYQVADVVELAMRDLTTPLRELCIDGESAKNDFLMQFQADILGFPVKRLGLEEASGLGSAILNCCACGIYTSVQEIKELRKISEICLPEMKPEERIRNRQGWLQAVHAVMLTAKR